MQKLDVLLCIRSVLSIAYCHVILRHCVEHYHSIEFGIVQQPGQKDSTKALLFLARAEHWTYMSQAVHLNTKGMEVPTSAGGIIASIKVDPPG